MTRLKKIGGQAEYVILHNSFIEINNSPNFKKYIDLLSG